MKRNIQLISLFTCIAMASTLFGCRSSDDTASMDSVDKALKENAVADAYIDGDDDVDIAEAVDYADADSDIALDDVGYNNTIGSSSKDIDVKAGVLTAGVWNDNDNWGFFTNLVKSGTITFPSYCCTSLTNRIRVTLTDATNNPVKNATVELVSDYGTTIWNSVSDKNGVAYLFFYYNDTIDTIRVTVGEDSQEFPYTVNQVNADSQDSISTSSQEVEFTIDGSSTDYKNMEIMFIVDATGSMCDEILFLQSEFSAIAEEIGNVNTTYSVNFYRDTDDEYITKCFDFTDDIQEVQSILNSQSAEGGGDRPEAVAEILDETIVQKQWGNDTVKLAFLIFDAPPHDDTAKVLDTAIRTASEKGIRIIPVVSSNTDRDTEIFARTLSIATNGTYVFLTDDSGVGSEHLEPIIGDYEVEKLFDAIVRIINDYRQ